MSAREIIILQPNAPRPQALRETLQSGGFSSRVVNSTEELEEVIEKNPDYFTLIDVGDEETEALELMEQTLASKIIRQTALIVLGKEADAFETALDKYFTRSITLNTPCSATKILEAVQYLEKQIGPVPSVDYIIQKVPSTVSTTLEPLADLEETVPKVLFEKLSQLPPRANNTVTKQLRKPLTFESLEQMGMVARDGALREAARETYSTLPAWSRDHLCRVTFLSHRFVEVLRIPSEQAAHTRDAGLLLACGFVSQSNKVLRKNYLVGNSGIRHEVASKLKDSAMKVMSEYGSAESGKIIASMARLLAQDEDPDDTNPEHVAAGCLLAGDLINRLCFQAGYWNPRGAHSMMRALKGRKISIIPTSVLACTLQFLSEAIVELPKTFLLRRTIRNSPEFVELAKRYEEYEPTQDEMRVPLNSLEPGMRLSKPIFAFDGREILAEEIILDQDLIWRLWQLSSIRPVNTPLVQKTDNVNQ